MAYRRYKKRRFSRKHRSSGGGLWNVAKKALWIAKGVKNIVNAEKHYFDTDITANYSSTATITDLTQIAEGNDYNGRSGRSLLAKSVYMRGYLNMSLSATVTSVRMMIVMDTQNTGSAPAFTDIVQNNAVSSPLNVSTDAGRFRIMYDKMAVLQINNNRAISLYCFKKFSKHVRFEGTAGTDSARNAMFFVCVSSEATNTPAISGYCRVGYYDN